jgi:hypothetical protein
VSALPHAVYRVCAKRGSADCAIAAMATIFRRDPEEILIAAAKVRPTVWQAGLPYSEIMRVVRKLKIKAAWTEKFDADDDIGVLWVGYNDVPKEHCVALIEGWVLDPDHDPVSLWRYSEYMMAHNAYGHSLLQVTE